MSTEIAQRRSPTRLSVAHPRRISRSGTTRNHDPPAEMAANGAGQKGPDLQIQHQGESHNLAAYLWRHTSNWGCSAIFHAVLLVVLGLFSWKLAERPLSTVHITASAEQLVRSDPSVEKMLAQSIDYGQAARVPGPTVAAEPGLSSLRELALVGEAARLADSLSHGANVAAIVGGPDPSMVGIAGKGGWLSTDVRPRASFYGIEAEGSKFVYVVDRSGSMAGQRWMEARAELLRSIEQLAPEQEFFVILFNDQTAAMLDWTGARLALASATRENVQLASRWVMEQLPGGNTFPRDSMEMALRLKPDAIFLLSDGEFRDGTLEALRRRNRPARHSTDRKNTVIHTIAFKSMSGAFLLQQIAAENGGNFRFIP